MQRPKYEPNYPVELYEALHRGNAGDLKFYQRVTSSAQSILELGCGSGRVVTQLGGKKGDVWGIESHIGLLEQAKRKVIEGKNQKGADITLVHADMFNFDLNYQFDCIIVPYNGLYYAATEEELRSGLRCVRNHLRSAGQLIFDVYAVDDFHLHGDLDEYDDNTIEHVAVIEIEGEQYSVYESSQWNRDQQQIEVRYLHVPSQEDDAPLGLPVETRILHRYFLQEQIEILLRECDFESIELHGDFAGSPFDSESELLVVTAM